MYYACISYATKEGMRHAGTTYAETFTQLKRQASRIANNHYSTLDKMEVSQFVDGHETTATYYRINKKVPNNTIKRGTWR